MKDRGASLASTLLLSAIAMAMAFTLAGVSFTHLSVASKLGNSQQARNLAEAAIARACEKIFLTQGKYGTADGPADRTVAITVGVPDRNLGQGYVTFDPAQADELDIRLSTNNLKGKDPIPGVGRQVPPQAVHLFGVGRCNGVERRIEAILAIPTYRHAITTSGPFASNGGLVIVGVDKPADLEGGLDPEEERAGNLASNGLGPEAVMLHSTEDQETRITGDVRAGGGIQLGDYTTVVGEVRPSSSNVAIPKLEITDYDPGGNAVEIGGSSLDPDTGEPRVLKVDKMILRRNGNLDCQKGIDLNEGVLYVDGNVTVQEGVHGKGAIIATGNISLEGDGAQEGDKGVALLAKGDLTVKGIGPNSAYTQGLAYSSGNVTIANATFVGAVVANAEGGSTVTVDQGRVVHTEVNIEMLFTLPYGCGDGRGTMGFNPGDGLVLKDYFDTATNTFVVPGDLGGPGGPRLAGDGEWHFTTPSGEDRKVFNYRPAANRNAARTAYNALDPAPTKTFEQAEADNWDIQLGGVRYARKVWEKTRDESNKEGQFSLDPSRFLQLESKTLFTLWRDY